MINTIIAILKKLIANRKTLFKAISLLSVGLLLSFSINTYKQNKKLSESLEQSQNNVEAYQELYNDSQQASSILKLTIDQLQNSKDSVIQKLDSVRKELKLKPKQIKTAATQTQVINVIKSKGVKGDILVKDTIYTDSIQYNPLTTVHYTIGKDTVSIGLNVENTQYLYIYTTKEYKNKKNFIKRLFTLDFKKVKKYKYKIVNTNDLLKNDDVRIVESNN